MPKAGKIFIYREELSIEEISEQLEGWREEEHVQFNGDAYDLLNDIQNLYLNEGELAGLYQYDYVISPTGEPHSTSPSPMRHLSSSPSTSTRPSCWSWPRNPSRTASPTSSASSSTER
uniref:Uncharacterized protein n=1 Tax=viral metagenome TaxID=1070528 RepID=A0A6M3LWE5_9ZZZZ